MTIITVIVIIDLVVVTVVCMVVVAYRAEAGAKVVVWAVVVASEY